MAPIVTGHVNDAANAWHDAEELHRCGRADDDEAAMRKMEATRDDRARR